MADPGERSLDDPAFGKHGEAMQFIALDDRQLPGAGLGDGGRGLLPRYPASAKINLMKGKKRRVRRLRTSRAPSRSAFDTTGRERVWLQCAEFGVLRHASILPSAAALRWARTATLLRSAGA